MIEVADLVVAQFELIERQFAAGDDHRPSHATPALIDCPFQLLPLFSDQMLPRAEAVGVVLISDRVQRRIEDGDDAVLGQHGIRHVDVAAIFVEEATEPLRDRRLAVARRAINENRTTAAHCRPQLIQQLRPDDHPLKRFEQPFGITLNSGNGLRAALRDIRFERNRSRADITALLKRLARSRTAEIGQVEAVRRAADEVARRDFDALLILEESQAFVDQVERQPRVLSDIDSQQISVQVNLLQDQLADLHPSETAVLQRLRCFRGMLRGTRVCLDPQSSHLRISQKAACFFGDFCK